MTDLNELALAVVEEMVSAGYSNTTAWRMYLDAYQPLIRFHRKRGLTTYDPLVTTDFCNQLQERRLNGTHNPGNARRILASISRLRHYYDTGKIDYDYPKRCSSFKLNSYYEELLNDYASHNEVHPNTRGDIVCITRKFFAWLLKNEHQTLDKLTSTEIQAFMVHCSKHLANSSLHNVQLYLRKL